MKAAHERNVRSTGGAGPGGTPGVAPHSRGAEGGDVRQTTVESSRDQPPGSRPWAGALSAPLPTAAVGWSVARPGDGGRTAEPSEGAARTTRTAPTERPAGGREGAGESRRETQALPGPHGAGAPGSGRREGGSLEKPGGETGTPAEGRAVPPVPPPAPEPPPRPPEDPAEAWKWALRSLNAHQQVLVTENAAYVSFAGGTLTLVVRVERWRPILQEHLADVDFPSALPGFRRLEIRCSEDEGRTGREARSIEEAARYQAAVEAVERSPLVKRLVDALAGRVDVIEVSRLEGSASEDVEEG